MSSTSDIFKAYQQEIDAIHRKYRFDPDNKEYDHERGIIHREYALEYIRNAHQQESLQLFANAESSFMRSGDNDELAKTILAKAKALESFNPNDKDVLDNAQHAYQRALYYAPEEQKLYYQAELDAFLKRR